MIMRASTALVLVFAVLGTGACKPVAPVASDENSLRNSENFMHIAAEFEPNRGWCVWEYDSKGPFSLNVMVHPLNDKPLEEGAAAVGVGVPYLGGVIGAVAIDAAKNFKYLPKGVKLLAVGATMGLLVYSGKRSIEVSQMVKDLKMAAASDITLSKAKYDEVKALLKKASSPLAKNVCPAKSLAELQMHD
jgi:hypothetical protein